MRWFSSKVRLVCLIEPDGAPSQHPYMDNVYVFRSLDFSTAFHRALALGRAQEEEYRNGDGARVRWRLKEVISLDQLPDELDGAEVYSEPVDLAAGERIGFDAAFHPEASQPTQTV